LGVGDETLKGQQAQSVENVDKRLTICHSVEKNRPKERHGVEGDSRQRECKKRELCPADQPHESGRNCRELKAQKKNKVLPFPLGKPKNQRGNRKAHS